MLGSLAGIGEIARATFGDGGAAAAAARAARAAPADRPGAGSRRPGYTPLTT